MADAGAAGDIAKELSDPWGSFASWIVSLIPSGPLNHLALVILGVSAVLAVAIYKYHLGLIDQGTAPEGSIERKDYERLRASLQGDNWGARTYKRWLEIALDKVDRFFGDAGMADRSLFPHAFGLRKAWPFWTAPAFDRCLLLALIYPIFMILMIWTISGQVGPAEEALLLPADWNFWLRFIRVVAIGCPFLAAFLLPRPKGWTRVSWLAILVWTTVLTVAFTSSLAGSLVGMKTVSISHKNFNGIAIFLAIANAVTISAAGSGASAFAAAFAAALAIPFFFIFTILPVAIVAAFGFHVGVVSAVPVVGGMALFILFVFSTVLAVDVAYNGAQTHRRQDVFLTFYLLAMLAVCLAAAFSLSRDDSWRGFCGPLLVFLGLLTLLNAPFDWASLGLTRALLRRGLELGAWWPLLLAMLDGALASAIIFCLALTIVLGVQAFDDLAAVQGGEIAKVLPLPKLFDGMEANPAAPEYWWVYALLLSTMFPSLLNLMIGGMALTRGIPWLAWMLLQWMPPAGQGVPKYKQNLMALGLTIQTFAGAILGIAAQAIIVWGLLYHILPFVGLDLLAIARELEKLDLPGALIALALPHPG